MKIKTEDMTYDAQQIAEMTTQVNYWGFTGETCDQCKKTANVFIGKPRWFCCKPYLFKQKGLK